MPYEFRLPDLGEGIQEAQLLAWNVSEGQTVAAFQTLCQVESAKAAVELTAPVAGRVGPLRAQPGDTLQLGDVLVVIETDAEWFGIVGRPPETHAPVRAAPFVRKLARDLNVRLEDIVGSGPQGRIKAADVESVAQPSPSGRGGSDRDERIPLRGLRKQIAEHMLEAVRHAPQVTAMDLFDVTELVLAVAALRSGAEAEGVKLTYLPFVVKACVAALQAVPEANASVDDDAVVLKRDYNIGIATAVPGGLVVPVVKHADRLTLLEIGGEIERLVSAARERRSPPADLQDGTFTITSFGGLPGSPMFATPILNYPEVAILGFGRVELQPRVVDGQILARHCVGISLTFDHRVLDGEAAGRFMAVLRRYLEQPLQFLLRVT